MGQSIGTAVEPLEPRDCWSVDFGSIIAAGAGGSDRGSTLAIDEAGDAIVGGLFNSTVDFDPSSASTKLTASSKNAAFIAKYSSAGKLVWARALAGSGEQNIQAVATDENGDVYAAGFYSGKIDFDTGAGIATQTAKGGHDAFVLKLDAAGKFIWARSLGGGGEEGCTALAVDAGGNAYAVGMFASSGDYDPGTRTRTLSPHGSFDVFVTKLSASGSLDYAAAVGGSGMDYANGIAVDSAGHATVVGSFRGGVDFDPGPASHLLISAGGDDVFSLNLTATGAYRSAFSFGGTQDDRAGDVRLDHHGNTVIVGQFSGTADFDPSSVSNKLTAAGSTDAFIDKIDGAGHGIWAHRIGSTSADRATNLAVDGADNVYVTGQFAGTVDFDPGSGTQTQPSRGGIDLFAMKLTAAGSYTWARTAGGSGSIDTAEAIAVAGSGRVYITGAFGGTVDFDPSASSASRTASGTSDWFLWMLINA